MNIYVKFHIKELLYKHATVYPITDYNNNVHNFCEFNFVPTMPGADTGRVEVPPLTQDNTQV